MALINGKPTRKDFFDVNIHEKNILDLSRRVSYASDPESDFPSHFPGVVKIKLRNGDVVEHQERFNKGCPENPLTRDEVVEKFLDNVEGILNMSKAEELIEKIEKIEQSPDLSSLVRLCKISP